MAATPSGKSPAGVPESERGDTQSHACRQGRADATPEASPGSEREPAADGAGTERQALVSTTAGFAAYRRSFSAR